MKGWYQNGEVLKNDKGHDFGPMYAIAGFFLPYNLGRRTLSLSCRTKEP